MDRILKGILQYRQTYRKSMVEEFKRVADRPEVIIIKCNKLCSDNVIPFIVIFQPKAVFFTCMDSRMLPTRFTQTHVGDMFIVRNAGNLVPHSRLYGIESTTTEPAALELGVVVNNVKHIVVCGHSDCKVKY